MKNLRMAALLALLVMGVVSTMEALPQTEIYSEFYSDDTFTEVVGWTYRGCVGGASSWGVRTEWVRRESTSCGNSNTFSCKYLYCAVNCTYVNGTYNCSEDCDTISYCF